SLLQQMGFNPQNIDASKLKVYGNGGALLPLANDADRPDDLVENAVMQVNRPDGSLDYLIFYAQGPHDWYLDKTSNLFRHRFNVYSDTAYYFVTLGNTPGLRVGTQQTTATPNKDIYTFNDRTFHEQDLQNVLKSGREWYGETFNTFSPSRTFTFGVSDIAPNSTVHVTAALMGSSNTSTTFNLSLNGSTLGTQQIPAYSSGDYHEYGFNSVQTYPVSQASLQNSNNELKITINYNSGNSPSAMGYLNYLELNTERKLKLYGSQTAFQSLASVGAGNVSRFRIDGLPATAVVWNISNPLRPAQQQLTFSGSFGEFVAETDQLKEFVVFNGNNFANPGYAGRVANQNLHALNKNGNVDFVIVTAPEFKAAADRLANHRRTHDQMNVEVVTTRQIYNEFSSGAQELTAIRDFMKMIYDRSNKSGDNLVQLLLFGDASYDYKYRTPNNTNYVPVFESPESLHPINSHSSDDFVAFLDDTEGAWSTNDNSHEMDMGVGRLPVHSATQAEDVVNKLIRYDQTDTFGKWRNRITFVCDDSDNNEYLRNSEILSSAVETARPAYNTDKIYLDMFSQVSVPSGQRAPDVNKAINKAVEQGSLILNYVGHGGETGWASEQILTVPQINNWVNQDKLTFMITATCEFGRYDDPGRPSGAEYALYNSNGGAAGLITTTRPVYSNTNQALNERFYAVAFTPVTKNGQTQMPRLGDLQQKTKNGSIAYIANRGFALLGDPSMRLAYPELKVEVDKVNDKPVSAAVSDTLRALSVVKLDGSIRNQQGTAVLTSFNGEVQITLFEKESEVRTLGDEKGSSTVVKVRQNIIYDGLATVNNGNFTVQFVVPKDISYNFGSGKISLYAHNQTTDAHGGNRNVIIGGSDPNAAADNTPPAIDLFMDDESFKFGGMTGTNSTLIAKLFDDNGINTAGIGIGHEITASLDGSSENVVVLNDYYTADLDSYKSGRVRYLFKDLSNGPHSLKVKAWDTHNNSNEAYLEFIVANTEGLALNKVLNWPNPFVGNEPTWFMFDHNRTGDDLDIQVQIFTTSGKLIKTLETTSYASKSHIEVPELKWNGRDEYNDKLAKGVYIYKVTVRSQRDGSKATKYEKLVMLK
ncbi:MAG: type IX secretion system sortase PorU, partial [Hymenobacteraceae bacterium]|nr:type IX secretion system sortase PorU [Hymenobacteraceae bacterium]MDX5395232.1 type IX secretion system sortase PorU [Hymenobacteraceae bacterium]MDX5443739.1 type IX secretion system sortase PorU [Hymenobacteraceae bacterium]MDX5511270.1 type IX secretion system sortase PorU [Hymenobacteraceae bacterium]